MITNTPLLILCLIAIESFILALNNNPKTQFLFKFLPAIFWLYFTPLLLTHFGLFPAEHIIYKFSIRYVLPLSLALLLIPVDIVEILKLGKPALIMMLAGTFGIMLGTCAAVSLFHSFLPEGGWLGLGTVAASWMGGSSNMIAVKEAVGTPDSIFSSMVVVDAFVGYSWMGLLVALVCVQQKFDVWNKADTTVITELRRKVAERKAAHHLPLFSNAGFVIAAAAAAAVLLAHAGAHVLPPVEGVVSSFTWVILAVTLIGTGMSFTRLRDVHPDFCNKTGNWLLYFVLTTIGAHASLSSWSQTASFILIGFFIVSIHGCVLLITARIIKAPMFLIATASQANIGGVASGPLVAAVYEPSLAPVGLLLAILGNLLGTYLGILLTQICGLIV